MNFFIESVTTYSTPGKTRKGAIIQAVAKPFEHALLIETSALNELVSRLRALVNVCNNNYRGSQLYLSWNKDGDSGHISVHPKKSGSELNVVTISYAPVKTRLFDLTVFPFMGNVIRKRAPEIYTEIIIDSAKGGRK